MIIFLFQKSSHLAIILFFLSSHRLLHIPDTLSYNVIYFSQIVLWLIYLLIPKCTRQNNEATTEWQCKFKKQGTKQGPQYTEHQITVRKASVFTLRPSMGYLTLKWCFALRNPVCSISVDLSKWCVHRLQISVVQPCHYSLHVVTDSCSKKKLHIYHYYKRGESQMWWQVCRRL